MKDDSISPAKSSLVVCVCVCVCVCACVCVCVCVYVCACVCVCVCVLVDFLHITEVSLCSVSYIPVYHILLHLLAPLLLCSYTVRKYSVSNSHP